LSGENTPTLNYVVPAFKSFILRWEELIEDNPDWQELIEPGLNKLRDYEDLLTDTHLTAMGKQRKLYPIYRLYLL
jgi:hypothetical protein